MQPVELLNLAYYSDTLDGAGVSRVPRPACRELVEWSRPAVPAAGVEPEHTGLRALRRQPQSTRRDKTRRGTLCLRKLALPMWLSL